MTLRGWLVLIALASLTLHRLPAWESDVALWTAAAQVAPASIRAHLNRRAAALLANDWETALQACDILRTLSPRADIEARLVQQACELP